MTKKFDDYCMREWLRALDINDDVHQHDFDPSRPRILCLPYGRRFRVRVVDERRPRVRVINIGRDDKELMRYPTTRFYYVTQLKKGQKK